MADGEIGQRRFRLARSSARFRSARWRRFRSALPLDSAARILSLASGSACSHRSGSNGNKESTSSGSHSASRWKRSHRYLCGSICNLRQLAVSEYIVAAVCPPWGLPKKSQAFLPKTDSRIACSLRAIAHFGCFRLARQAGLCNNLQYGFTTVQGEGCGEGKQEVSSNESSG